MRNTYGLAIVLDHATRLLNLPPMSLAQAERARETLANAGKQVSVVNRESI